MPDVTQFGEMFLLQWIICVGAFVAGVLFLLTQQKSLRAVRKSNRLLLPGLVWLQIIPIFGQV
jgi:hypothetical protein